ncbi:MAG TPA: alkaline phosphatase family protein [Verrucomicrobiae bacterium]|jgi:DNA-binding beta-propeller fold protein YncE|nr:alkaline phosphatase family protein [Verrucomicrobiae bacterium]
MRKIFVILFSLLGVTGVLSDQRPERQIDPFEKVNTGQPGGPIITPVNQVLTPLGIQVELFGLRPQTLALSPDGKILATSGKTHEVVLINPDTGDILDRIPLPPEKTADPAAVSTHILEPDSKGQASFTGLIFSRDGRRIYLSNVNGSIKIFALDGEKFKPVRSLSLPKTGLRGREAEIPAGLALSEDGTRLFVVGNMSNRLFELDVETGTVVRAIDVGFAPYDVVLLGQKAYVSNWGGRRPDRDSVTGPAGHGTKVRVDPITFIANEGSVSVVDLSSGHVVSELSVGVHSSAMALSPDRRYLAVANAASDSISVIDTKKDRIAETVSLRWDAGDPFGASPNALAFSASGSDLYVCNGTQNAVAVVTFRPGRSKIRGLIPTGWFPGAIVYDAPRHRLHIANIKGFGSGKRLKPGDPVKFNSHQYFGSVSLIDTPSRSQLAKATTMVLDNMRRAKIEDAFLPPRVKEPARPVPERTGEPSVFKQVVYIIKENRTYDQVLGDMKEGNGNEGLCIFGEKITPNQHKIAREFALLDNTYCSGILSSEGHNWTDAGFSTDYLEKSFAGFPRSYPDGMEPADVDALAYSPAGFIWDLAFKYGKSVRSYGEFTMGHARWKNSARRSRLKFRDIYNDFINRTDLIEIGCVPAIESLRGHIMTNTIGWSLDVPDIFRAAQFITELKQFEERGGFPQLVIICLPNDHTSGTKANMPTPRAHAADNDLAFGQIIEAISKSRFWKDTCIFGIEDDPQDGWDHVSGFRTTAYVVSPYTKRRTVVRDSYNQTSLLRTIELMIGLPPLNQMDASATPMTACFMDSPDLTPFTAVPNQVALDELNPPPKAINDPVLRRDAIVSAGLPLEKADACPEDTLNRILWRAQKGSQALYPAWALTHVRDEDDK